MCSNVFNMFNVLNVFMRRIPQIRIRLPGFWHCRYGESGSTWTEIFCNLKNHNTGRGNIQLHSRGEARSVWSRIIKVTSGLRIRYIASPSHDSGDFGLSDLIYRFTFSVAVLISDLRIRYVAFASWYSQKKRLSLCDSPFSLFNVFQTFSD